MKIKRIMILALVLLLSSCQEQSSYPEKSIVISTITRLKVPWLGPIVDVLGFTVPLAVGDVDTDARNELLISLMALDYGPANQSYNPEMLVKAFEWNGKTYTLDHLLPVEQATHTYDISKTSNMIIMDWGEERVLAIGSSPWRTNQDGYLSIVTLRNNTTISLLETVCLGSVYYLTPVEVDQVPTLFVSTTSNHNNLVDHPDLELCMEREGIYSQEKPAIVMIKQGLTGFTFSSFEQEGDTLLIEKLPNKQGNLYAITSNWTGETPSLQLWIIHGNNFSTTDILPNYSDKYVVQIITADLNGDNTKEILVLWGLTGYRPQYRSSYNTVGNLHLDIYQWQTDRYHQVWQYQPSVPVGHLSTGDLDNDGKEEVIFGIGNVLDMQGEQYIVDDTLIHTVNKLDINVNLSLPRFLVADTNNDGWNEIVMLAGVKRQAIPQDVWLRMVEREGDFVQEDAYKAPMPDTGVYYVYIMELEH